LRRDTAANWTIDNPVLALGETGWETDTRRVKLGDGTTAWNDLPFAADEAASVAAETARAEAAEAALDVRVGSLEATEATYGDIVTHNASEFTTDAELATEATTRGNADTALDARLDTVEGTLLPSGVMEGRTLFQYGPSRGVGVTAQRIHFNRIRERLGSGFWFNGSVAGYLASDTGTYALGTVTGSRQANGINEWSLTSGVGTWAVRANQGGVIITWPFGNDARLDGLSTRNSTTAKARASAVNGLHALVALARTEIRLESATNISYTRTIGSPDITGNVASPWFQGMLVQGTGIPANTYVGTMINGGLGGFHLSSSRTSQVNVNATASGTSVLTFSPVYTGTWLAVTSTSFSGGAMVKSNATGPVTSWVIHLPEARRVHWQTTAVDDAEYVATAAAPFGGTGGMGYSIVVDGGAAIVGTTSDQHRFGTNNLCYGPQAVDLGTLGAGSHTIVVTGSGVNKLLVDDCLLIESLTPLTTVLMKEVELPAAYYTANAATGASFAKTQIYNGFVDDELARWPADDSVIVLDPIDFGYDLDLHVSDADGAYAHFNDAGERVMADGILTALNLLAGREGLVWT
jgi:hypothetical protein